MNSSMIVLAQSAPAAESFFEGFSTDQRFAIVLAVIVGVVVLAFIFGAFWEEIKKEQIAADLKRDMLDRGMTADEIERVFEAAPRSGFYRWLSSWCKKM